MDFPLSVHSSPRARCGYLSQPLLIGSPLSYNWGLIKILDWLDSVIKMSDHDETRESV